MKINLSQGELSISNILTESWGVYKTLFKPIVLITLVVYVPINIILFYLPSADTWEGIRANLRMGEFLENFIGVLATMAIAVLVKNHLDGKELPPFQALGQSAARWLPAIGTSLLAGICMVGLILLLVVPAIIFGGYWVFMIYCVILAKKSGMSALKYSKSIVQGRWWKVYWYNLVFVILALLVGVVFGLRHFFIEENLVVSLVFNSATDTVLAYFSVVSTMFYLNFEATRKELNQENPVPVPVPQTQ